MSKIKQLVYGLAILLCCSVSTVNALSISNHNDAETSFGINPASDCYNIAPEKFLDQGTLKGGESTQYDSVEHRKVCIHVVGPALGGFCENVDTESGIVYFKDQGLLKGGIDCECKEGCDPSKKENAQHQSESESEDQKGASQ